MQNLHLLVCSLLFTSLLEAYSCSPGPDTPCGYLNPSAVVFKGRVLESRPNNIPGPRAAGEHTKIVRFEVIEGLYNIESSGQVEAFTSVSPAPGTVMLVISNRIYNGQLSLSSCIANQKGLQEAMERYIRQSQLQEHKLNSLNLTITKQDSRAQASVHLQGPVSRVADTNDSGTLTFENLPSGQYKVEAIADGYETPAWQSKVDVSPFSCQTHYITLQGIHKLTATVRNSDGLPESGIAVDVSKSSPQVRFIGRAVSNQQGKVRFGSLAPGEYVLKTMPASQPEIEFLAHPSELTKVEIGGEHEPTVQLLAFRRQRVLAAIRFIDPSGAPLAKQKILTSQETVGITDREGRLNMPVLEFARNHFRFTSSYGASKWESIEASSLPRTVVLFPY
jgi:hypothetical protein